MSASAAPPPLRRAVRRSAAFAVSLLLLALTMFTATPTALADTTASPPGSTDVVVSEAGFTHPGIYDNLDVTRPGVSGDRIPWKDLSYGTSQ